MNKMTGGTILPILGLCVALLLQVMPAGAVIEIAPLSDAELEARYRELIDELRCPKCQNQNLADSNSPIAADLRHQVRTLLEEGKSDDEIVAYLVDRYGEFVRYKPALSGDTAVLWFAPALLAVVGLVVIALVVGASRRATVRSGALDDDEQARLAALLDGDQPAQRREDNR